VKTRDRVTCREMFTQLALDPRDGPRLLRSRSKQQSQKLHLPSQMRTYPQPYPALFPNCSPSLNDIGWYSPPKSTIGRPFV
jgi:hypothetical protein